MSNLEQPSEQPATNAWVAVYRRRWFIVVALLTVSPIALIPLLTGPVYRKQSGDGSWIRIKASSRVIYSALALWLSAVWIYAYSGNNSVAEQLPACSDKKLQQEALQAVKDAYDVNALPQNASDLNHLSTLVEANDTYGTMLHRAVVAASNHELDSSDVRVCEVADPDIRPMLTVVVARKDGDVGGIVMNYGIPGAVAAFGDDVGLQDDK